MEDLHEASVESVTLSDILGLSSWDRPRSTDELKSFVTRHENAISHISISE